jgi:hypothetical protein
MSQSYRLVIAASLVLMWVILAPVASAGDAIPVDLCRVLRDPRKFAGKLIVVSGFINPLMHGTYLKEAGCDESVLLILPEQVPNYKGGITVLNNEEFERFLDARYNHLPDAPVFSAEFIGQVGSAKRGRRFGYEHNQWTRVILQSVEHGHTGP